MNIIVFSIVFIASPFSPAISLRPSVAFSVTLGAAFSLVLRRLTLALVLALRLTLSAAQKSTYEKNKQKIAQKMILGLIHFGFQKWVLSYLLKVAPRVRARLSGASFLVDKSHRNLQTC